MGRKLLLFIVGFLLLSGILVSRVFAQEEPQVIDSGSEIAPDFIPPYPGRDPGFLGQDHNYSLVFRGNGEAVVSARVILTNKGDAPLSEISLRVPKVEPREIFVYQAIRDKQCIRYRPQVYDPATRTYPPQICDEYQDADYYAYYGSAKYQKAKFAYVGDTLSVILPQQIAPNKSGSYFIFFRAGGYTTKNIFGAYKYDFETLKVNDDTRSLNVGVDVDSDLVLRGGQGEVQYRFADVSESTFKGVGGASPLASSAIDTFYTNIGQGKIIKTASNLAPLESYTVTGSFATSRLKLYGKELLIGVVVLIILLAIGLVVLKFALKWFNKEKEKEAKLSPDIRLVLSSLGISFATSLLILGYTVAVIAGASILDNIVSYQFQHVLTFLVLIISFAVYAVLLFAPGVYFGARRGIGWGILTVIFTILWLVFYMVIAILLLFLLRGPSSQGPVYPLLESLR